MSTETLAEQAAPVKQEILTTSIKGMVLCSDGGANPNPGPGGYGVHGYLWDTGLTLKGIGLGGEIATSRGYSSEKDKIVTVEKGKDPRPHLNQWQPVAVMPTHYLDLFGSVASPTTNNACEIIGMRVAMEYALTHDIEYLQLYTDSKYVIGGVMQWIDKWDEGGWQTRDGGVVANVNHWKDLKAARDSLVAKGVQWRVDWVRGHNGDRANEQADNLATLGVNQARRGMERKECMVHPPEGYWNSTAEKHPFIAHRRAYFNTLEGTGKPGEYYLGDHDKDDELAFKRVGDGSYSLIRLSEPDPLMEMIRSHQQKLNGGHDSIFTMYLDQIYSPSTQRDLVRFGEMVLETPGSYRMDLWHVGGQPLTREFKPARLAMRSVDILQELEAKLDGFLAGDKDVVSTEITSEVYDKVDKVIKGKKGEAAQTQSVCKLKASMVVGLTAIKTRIRHPFSNGEATAEVTLGLGIDLLERNALKRLENLNPRIYVIAWAESDKAYRYATVIQADDCVGIWSGHYSNMRLVA